MSETSSEFEVTDRDIRLVIAAIVLLALSGLGLLFTVFFLVRQANTFSQIQERLTREARVSAADHRANCSYKHYIRHQVTLSHDFLKKHPEGLPALGFTAAQIRSQIARQQAAIRALSDLTCP